MSGTLTTGKLILTQTTSNNDAFDRLRVSNPSTLFEINHSVGKLPFLIDEFTSGAGISSIAVLDNSYVAMTTTAGLTGCVIRQSYEYVPYQTGKSKLMIFSGVLNANWTSKNVTTGMISRIGCFDNYLEKTDISGSGNGLFFELDNKTLYAVERLNRTAINEGDTKVPQSAWNYDTFDGTGPSGLTIDDYSKAMIFAIDQEWLGVGRVRYGFFINGTFHVGHISNHSGIGTPTSSSVIYPYTKTAKLPIRYEISSSNGTYISEVNGEMRMICSTVLSEGGYEPTGMSYSIGRTTGVTVTSTVTPIIALQLLNSEPFNRKSILLRGISLLNSNSTKSIQWDLYVFPDDTCFNTATWTQMNSLNSITKYTVNPTFSAGLPAGGILIDSGYADTGVTISNFSYVKYLSSPLVNSSITGKSKVLCLCGVALTSDCTTHASLNWIEII